MDGADDTDLDRWVCGLLDRFEGPLLRYAARIVGDDRAQDVVQDAFLALCRQDRAAVEPHVAAWLYAVTRNAALNERRRGRPEGLAMTDSHRLDSHGLDDAPADGDGDPARRAEARDAAARVRVAAAALPESQQEALRLKVQHGLRYADIAEVMRVTPGHVAVLVHRAVSALRQRLGAPPQRAPAQGGSS